MIPILILLHGGKEVYMIAGRIEFGGGGGELTRGGMKPHNDNTWEAGFLTEREADVIERCTAYCWCRKKCS
jgi:hypothetical protein